MTGTQAVARQKSNEDVLADLRTVAARVGGPMSWKAYNQHRDPGMLQSHSVMGRFRTSWTGACERAGVASGARSRPTYSRQFSDDDLRATVREYLAAPESTGSYRDFEEWTAQSPDRPSAATIRTHLGKWSDVKASVASDLAGAPS